jgi:antitoxin component of MazEF toxin-antitoxin module
MKDNLAKWRDAQSEFRQNLKELIDQMKGNLQSDLRRNVEQGAREGGRK